MKKLYASLSVLVISASLVAGCTSNAVRNQSTNDGRKLQSYSTNNNHYGMNNYRNNGYNTLNNRGNFRPLDVNDANQGTASATTGTTFSDVPTGEWYADSVNWGSSLGIVSGYPDGTFQPDRSVTRAEVLKIIKSMADTGIITVPSGGTTAPTPTPTVSPVATATPTDTTSTPGTTTDTTGGTTTGTTGGTTTGTTTDTTGGTTTATPGTTTGTTGGTTTGGTTTAP